jgi:hypothetical protein
MRKEILAKQAVQMFSTKMGAITPHLSKTAAVSIEREVRVELVSLPAIVKQEGSSLSILQSILEEFPGGYIRVRKEVPGGFTFTKKVFKEHTEDNIKISEELFEKMFKLGKKPQDKTRVVWRGWDIDIMQDGRVVAEFVMSLGQTQVTVPSEFVVAKVLKPTVQAGGVLLLSE